MTDIQGFTSSDATLAAIVALLPTTLDGGALRTKEQSPISGFATSAKQDEIKAAVNAPTRGTRIPLATIVLAAETGVTEYALATGLPAGTEVDLVGVKGGLSASPGAATWRIHASDVTGWTPLDYEEECYTSAATAVASPIGDSIPNTPAMFTVPASGNIFVRVIPDAGTITGSVKLRIVRR